MNVRKLGRAFAWQFEDGDLGYWAEPTREDLLKYEKPSPGAKIVSVYIITRKDFKDEVAARDSNRNKKIKNGYEKR